MKQHGDHSWIPSQCQKGLQYPRRASEADSVPDVVGAEYRAILQFNNTKIGTMIEGRLRINF